MNYKNEQTILMIIKFTPPVFIISMSIVLVLFLYSEFKNTYTQEKNAIEKEFIEANKKVIKQNVDTVYNTIIDMQKNTENKLKESVKQRVYEAHTIATRIYEENKNKDKKTITKMIKDALVDIRFNNGRGYFYIYSLDYKCVLFPLNRRIEGKSFYDFKDGKGKYLTRDIVSQVKAKGEGFMNWHFYKPDDKDTYYKKIGFNKLFEPLGWFIGTGEYVDDFEKDVKTQALEYMSTLKYIDNNYIFALDYDGTYIYHIKKEIIGKIGLSEKGKNSANDVKNSNNVVGKAIELAKTKGEGFMSYVQNKKFDTQKDVRKTSYLRAIDNWNWFIGQGFYDDAFYEGLAQKEIDLENKFHEYMKNVIIFGIILMGALLFISIYISKIIQEKFTKYKKDIKEHILENDKQRAILAHQSKMSAMGEMLGNIAHQWRQPLSVVSMISTSYKAKKELGMEVKLDDLLEDMDKINNNVQYLSKTIDDFRDFIKGNNEIKNFNLKNDTSQFLQLIDSTIKTYNIDVIIDEMSENTMVRGYPNELIQCFINIFNNAKDALIDNNIAEEERYIFISEVVGEDSIKISFRDNAGGIPDDIFPKIFDPYFTTKHQSQGTGIGLHMTYQLIVEGMGGDIKARNVDFEFNGKNYTGAEFEIELPLEG